MSVPSGWDANAAWLKLIASAVKSRLLERFGDGERAPAAPVAPAIVHAPQRITGRAA